MRFGATTKLALLSLGLWGIVAASCALAGDIYVIAHPSVELAPGDIKEVYLGEKQFAGAVKLVPVDNAAVQGDFLAKAINLSADKYGAIWTKKCFRDGLSPPVTKSSDADVISFVKSTPGAVGYVSTPAAGVKMLNKYVDQQ